MPHANTLRGFALRVALYLTAAALMGVVGTLITRLSAQIAAGSLNPW